MGLLSSIKYFFVESCQWVFIRLPRSFSIPFIILLFLWSEAGYRRVIQYLPSIMTFQGLQGSPTTCNELINTTQNWPILPYLYGVLCVNNPIIIDILQPIDWIRFWSMIVIAFIGILVIYNISAAISRLLQMLNIKMTKPEASLPALADTTHSSTRTNHLDSHSEGSKIKIGIILAGGGAKGAYQAGAMRAIYEFLEKHNALDQVKMIAGTSIGSWNSLFWLTGLVKADKKTGTSYHQRWWSKVTVKKVFMPGFYVPLFYGSMVDMNPWKKQFDQIFGPIKDRLRDSKLTFYLTATNVNTGKLEITTNQTLTDTSKHASSDAVEMFFENVSKNDNHNEFLKKIKTGLFTSMALPPVVPMQEKPTGNPDKSNWFEDGGVVDNLPTEFGINEAYSRCDLLFIVALNPDFATKKAPSPVMLSRVLRALNIRQGVLERKSLKMIEKHNDLQEDPEKRIAVLAFCPEDIEIDTIEFWKTRQAGQAFERMYKAIENYLQTFEEKYSWPKGEFLEALRDKKEVCLYKISHKADKDIIEKRI